jgi:hypothetical protein
MTTQKTVIVSSAMTVGHFVAELPRVYATPTMILQRAWIDLIRKHIAVRTTIATAPATAR